MWKQTVEMQCAKCGVRSWLRVHQPWRGQESVPEEVISKKILKGK